MSGSLGSDKNVGKDKGVAPGYGDPRELDMAIVFLGLSEFLDQRPASIHVRSFDRDR